MDPLGTRLRQIREAKGLELKEIARLANCSVSMVSAIETGDRRPSTALARRLAVGYGISDEEMQEILIETNLEALLRSDHYLTEQSRRAIQEFVEFRRERDRRARGLQE